MDLPVTEFVGKTDPSRFFCSDPFFWICSYGIASGAACSSLDPSGFARTSFAPGARSLHGRPNCICCRSTSARASSSCRRKSAPDTNRTKLPARRPGSFPRTNRTGRTKSRSVTMAFFWHGPTTSPDQIEEPGGRPVPHTNYRASMSSAKIMAPPPHPLPER